MSGLPKPSGISGYCSVTGTVRLRLNLDGQIVRSLRVSNSIRAPRSGINFTHSSGRAGGALFFLTQEVGAGERIS